MLRVVENVQNDQLQALFAMWDFDGSGILTHHNCKQGSETSMLQIGLLEADELNLVIELHNNAGSMLSLRYTICPC